MRRMDEFSAGPCTFSNHFRSNKLSCMCRRRPYGGDAVLVSCVHVWRSSWRRQNSASSWEVRMVARTVERRAGVCGLLLVVCNRTPSKPRSVRGLLEKPCPSRHANCSQEKVVNFEGQEIQRELRNVVRLFYLHRIVPVAVRAGLAQSS